MEKLGFLWFFIEELHGWAQLDGVDPGTMARFGRA